MGDVAILAEGLSKLYRIGRREPYYTLRDTITRSLAVPFRRLRNRRQPVTDGGHSPTVSHADSEFRNSPAIWALKDVSFEIKKGEIVGIIGRNGAGKSTLLKILSSITDPTEGQAAIHGRVGSLLEVGTGFHPELTGRENVYLNGAILGMKKVEINQNFDEIVAFSGVEKFIDTPVKHYSSGMYMRLAFAVAAHLRPEILLVDEVLAVGDAAFQKKCLGKIGDVAQEGQTVLLVSHNMAAIKNLCTKCILFEAGSISAEGDSDKVIEMYVANLQSREVVELESRKDRKGNGFVRFTSVNFHSKEGCPTAAFLSGESCEIKLGYKMEKELSVTASILVGVGVYDIYGDCLFLCSNDLTNEISQGWLVSGEVSCRIPQLSLSSGLYKVNIYIAVNGEIADWVLDAAGFEVQNSDFFGTGRLPPPSHGRFLVSHSWSMDRPDDCHSGSGKEQS
jgi:lipopolysaccharide transport system ATP-binding protein